MAQPRTPDDKISLEIARLQKPLAGRRWLAWLLFSSVLLATLIIPLLAVWGAFGGADAAARVPADAHHKQALWGGAQAASTQAPHTPGSLDAMWNPGPLATSHQSWAHDCRACHSESFSRVKDADCLVCHKDVTDHVDRKQVTDADLTETRCATCHRDHKGPFGLVAQNKHYTATNCAACHADIKQSYPKTLTENVSDFADAHPDFRVQLATERPGVFQRVRLDKKLAERTTLKFPHDVHLVAGGVNGPKGKQKMVCNDCHTPDSAGRQFKPVTMKDHCQACHTLGFEPAVPGRQVPHGSEAEVLNTLREFYSFVAVSGVPLDRPADLQPIFAYRPGKEARAPSFVQGPGDAKTRAAAAATELFEKTGCVVCHEVSRVQPAKGAARAAPGDDLPQWKIAPVTAQHAYMPAAKFSHEAHATAA
ncbi:MAG: hypothetical protein RIR70_1389, partial [Pseudomonadota bacterium]